MHVNYWREINRSGFGRAGLALLFIITALAAVAPLLVRHSPGDYTGHIFHPPSALFWLGTNDVGQDIWAHLLYGARTSLAVAFGVSVLSVSLSVLAGGLAALCGGRADRLIMRMVDVLIIIPPVIVIILAAAYLRPDLLLLIALLAAIMWPGGARVVRAQALSLKGRMHVEAAGTFGAGRFYLLRRHIIPDMGPVLAAVLIQNARRAVFMEAGLSFLGVSDPSVCSWGKMMQHALKFSYLEVWKWWLLPAGAALSLTMAGLMYTGYALESALNPRIKREAGNVKD